MCVPARDRERKREREVGCVCVCVCVRETETEREREREYCRFELRLTGHREINCQDDFLLIDSAPIRTGPVS